jgi:hypothetical protein
MSGYIGNIVLGAILPFSFNTRDSAGNPITISGSPAVSIFRHGSTSPCNVAPTLVVNYNSQTGLHRVIIDTSVATSPANFYAVGNDYFAIITAGTVNGASVVGVQIGHFSIQNRAEDAALVTLASDITASQGVLATDITNSQTALGTSISSAVSTLASDITASQGVLATDITNSQNALASAIGTPAQAAALAADFATLVADISAIVTTSSGVVTGFTSGALSSLAGLTISVQLPANINASQGTIELTAGDDYLASINRSFNITFTGTLPDMTGGTAYIAFTSAKRVVRVIQMTIVSSTTSTLVIQVQLTAAQTGSFEVGAGTWEPQFTTAAGLKWSIPSTPANPWILLVDARPS